MAVLLPMSVALKPPDVNPPRCLPGSISKTVFPIFDVCTAAMTPAEVPPYTTTSYVFDASDGASSAAETGETIGKIKENCREDSYQHDVDVLPRSQTLGWEPVKWTSIG